MITIGGDFHHFSVKEVAFFERSSTKERYCPPPPNFGNDCEPAPPACRNNFFVQFLHTVVHTISKFYNCIIDHFSSFAQPQSKCLLLFFENQCCDHCLKCNSRLKSLFRQQFPHFHDHVFEVLHRRKQIIHRQW
jgi:hypothetical protein